MQIDNSLNWKEHIKTVSTKVSRAIGFLRGPLRDLGLRVSRAHFNGLRAPKDKIAVLQGQPGLHCKLFWAPGAQFLKIQENCHGNCLGSRAPSFQNDGLQGPSDPSLWGPLLKHAKTYLPQETLKTIYTGIFEPHFRYCCSIWSCAGSTELNQLQKLQNRAARIITNSSFDTPSRPLIDQLGWKTIEQLIACESKTVVFKSLHELAYLCDLFTRNSKC